MSGTACQTGRQTSREVADIVRGHGTNLWRGGAATPTILLKMRWFDDRADFGWQSRDSVAPTESMAGRQTRSEVNRWDSPRNVDFFTRGRREAGGETNPCRRRFGALDRVAC